MQLTDTPTYDNIKSTEEYLQIGSRFVKNISYVDVEKIDLPSEIEPYSLLGGNGAAGETAVDNFTFIGELEDYETIIYNQVISIPHQAQQQRELDKRRKSMKVLLIILLPMPLLLRRFRLCFIISL